MIEIKEIHRRDYKQAEKFAIRGMHFDWYMYSKLALSLYTRYFWYLELDRAARAYAAYEDGRFLGALLVAMKGKKDPTTVSIRPSTSMPSNVSKAFSSVMALPNMKKPIGICTVPSSRTRNPMGRSPSWPPTPITKAKASDRPC